MVRTQKGFTLIELVMVIVILGILAAVVIPKYVDLSTQAANAAKITMQANVKAAWAALIGQNLGVYPTVSALAAATDGGTAVATGITSTINGTLEKVQTYLTTTCGGGTGIATAATSDTVKCVGDITP